ncbi:hypothetical protein SAMN06297422_1077 [Lachnospiraceae bacterium]|nr:hypothetical protein SAMN06297422_1077 [Lachnospiraceae bacterium]
MNSTDFKDLIRAWDDFMKMDHIIIALSGGSGLDYDEFLGLWNIESIIRRNSKYSKYHSDEMNQEYLSILNSTELSVEEKYNRLTN